MLGTSTHRGPSVRNTASEGWRTVQVAYGWVVGLVLLAFGLSPMVMALSNIIGWQPLTAAWSVLITFAILIWGLRPTNLGWVGIIGGTYALLMDRDGSQGVAAGPKWLWNVVISIAFAHFMMGLIATVWDFQHVSGGFLAVWFVGLGFVLWNLKYNTEGRWYKRLTIAALLICTVGIIWQSFDINLKEDLFHQAAFDPVTGEPLKMGYITHSGDWIEDPLGRTPAECRPAGYSHFAASGDMFPYATDGTCRSNITGERLIPIAREYVPDTSRTTLPGMFDWLFQTEQEREAAEAKRVLEELKERAEERRREAAEVESRRAVTNTVVYAPPKVVRKDGCSGAYRNTRECETIVFPAGMSTEWVLDPIPGDDRDRCVQFYPKGLTVIPRSQGVFELRNTSNFERTFKVYEVFAGEAGPGNNRCG